MEDDLYEDHNEHDFLKHEQIVEIRRSTLAGDGSTCGCYTKENEIVRRSKRVHHICFFLFFASLWISRHLKLIVREFSVLRIIDDASGMMKSTSEERKQRAVLPVAQSIVTIRSNQTNL